MTVTLLYSVEINVCVQCRYGDGMHACTDNWRYMYEHYISLHRVSMFSPCMWILLACSITCPLSRLGVCVLSLLSKFNYIQVITSRIILCNIMETVDIQLLHSRSVNNYGHRYTYIHTLTDIRSQIMKPGCTRQSFFFLVYPNVTRSEIWLPSWCCVHQMYISFNLCFKINGMCATQRSN